MKKVSLILLAIFTIVLFAACNQDVTVDAQVYANMEVGTFMLNGKGYATLQEAVNVLLGKGAKSSKAAATQEEDVIYLMKDASGPGAVIDNGTVVIDFNNYTYSFTNVTGLQTDENPQAESFGLGITNGAQVTLRGLQQIDLNDTTTNNLTMVYVEGATTSLTIENAPKMVVEPTQYVFWASNGATLTIGGETKVGGGVAATGTESSIKTTESAKLEASTLKAEGSAIVFNSLETPTVQTLQASGEANFVVAGAAPTVVKNDSDASASYKISNTTEEPVSIPDTSGHPIDIPSNQEVVVDEGSAKDPADIVGVASIRADRYATLALAVYGAKDGDTILLLKDINLETTGLVISGKDITLDLNGKTITGAVNGKLVTIAENASVTIIDSSNSSTGRIYNTDSTDQGHDAVCNYGTAIINGGEFGKAETNRGAGFRNLGTATINGGKFHGHYSSGSAYAYAIINGSSVYQAQLTINNAVVSSDHGAVCINAGKAVINGGSFTATRYYAVWITNDGHNTSVTINDGSFNSTLTSGTSVLYASVDDGNQDASDADIKIYGGTYTYTGSATNKKAVELGYKTGTSTYTWGMTLYGGTYSIEPESSYVAPGYVVVQTGTNEWTVQKEREEVTVVTATKTETMSLARFRNNWNDGDYSSGFVSATLTADVVDISGSNWYPIGTWEFPFYGTFDGDGHTISGLKGISPDSNHIGINSNGDTIGFGETFGFFGIVGAGDVTVQNVNFTDVNINIYNGKDVGAVIGYIPSTSKFLAANNSGSDHFINTDKWTSESHVGDNSLTLSHVTVSGNIVGNTHVGGLVGKAYNSDAINVSYCTNNANITATSESSAGIIAYVAYASSALFDHCTNNGSITAPKGFAGIVHSPNGYSLTASNCSNTGELTWSGNSYVVNGFGTAEDSADNWNFIADGCGSTGVKTFVNNTNSGKFVWKEFELNVAPQVGYFGYSFTDSNGHVLTLNLRNHDFELKIDDNTTYKGRWTIGSASTNEGSFLMRQYDNSSPWSLYAEVKNVKIAASFVLTDANSTFGNYNLNFAIEGDEFNLLKAIINLNGDNSNDGFNQTIQLH